MHRCLYIILCFVLLSCQRNAAEHTPTPQELIVGEWKEFHTDKEKRFYNGKYYPFTLPSSDVLQGLTFTSDSTFIYKNGFFNDTREKRRLYKTYLGDTTMYHIRNDSLYFYDLKDNSWRSLKIQKLTKDTLIVRRDKEFAASYIKQTYPEKIYPAIDRIALSSYRCLGYCPVYDLLIKKNGEVILFGYDFINYEGPHTARISEKRFNDILSNFHKTTLYDLKEQYGFGFDGWGMTASLAVNNQLFKTMYNFEFEEMPAELYWAYRPLIFMYEEVGFKPLPLAELPEYQDVIIYAFNYDKLVGHLESTESILLWDYLRSGKVSSEKFDELYTLTFSSLSDKHDSWPPPPYFPSSTKSIGRITSDGRYFKFYYKSKPPVTIDLGFNYVDTNPREINFRRSKTKVYQ